MSNHVFTALFPFCGLGAGARGFLRAIARLGSDAARFENLGGIDVDPESCRDFEYLTGAQALCADLHTLRPADLLGWLESVHGEKRASRRPDAVFLSPPCKGFSRLLGAEAAAAPEYQELNNLVYEGLFLILETWKEKPPLLVIENVPGIKQRGAELLDRVRRMLGNYGYVFHAATHDCGEIGGLAQHRIRYLMVARLPRAVPAFVYRPPEKRVRGCGEVLGRLVLPGDPTAGDMHILPSIKWLNWVRLAHIPPGGDWRDLPRAQPVDAEARKAWEQRGEKLPGQGPHWFKGKYGIGEWEKPSRTVVGGPNNGANFVAEPLALECNDNAHRNKYAVGEWNEPAKTVIGASRPGSGAACVAEPIQLDHAPRRGTLGVLDSNEPAHTIRGRADPRTGPFSVAEPLAMGKTAEKAGAWSGRPGLMGVLDWSEPSPAVIGKASVSGGHATAAVADPLPLTRGEPFGNVNRVLGWSDAAGTITHAPAPSSGAPSVADPRVPTSGSDAPFRGNMGVNAWDQPARTVKGESYPTNGGGSVAQPLLPGLAISDETRGGALGVVPWSDPAPTVTGHVSVSGSNTPGSVAQPLDQLAVNGRKGKRYRNQLRVRTVEEPAGTVTGDTDIQEGAQLVAEPLGFVPGAGGKVIHPLLSPVQLGQARREVIGRYKVVDWRKPAPTVAGPGTNGLYGVADERTELALKCKPRAGVYGVLSWQQAAATVIGEARIDNGKYAVADPRVGEPGWRPPPWVIPVIVSPWGCWHRPLTTLELAALQGLPARLKGKPLELAGDAVSRWRERIGNAVPVQAGTAIARSLLKALLAATIGGWSVDGPPGEEIWVRDDGREVEAPALILEPELLAADVLQ